MNKQIKSYVIANEYQKVEVLNIGACLYKIETADCHGHFSNVVLNHPHYSDYLKNDEYFGVVVGPCCGRIAYGNYHFNHKEYNLDINNGKHHLHGGYIGISRSYFDVILLKEDQIKLKYHYKDLSFGYSGNVVVEITYQIIKNELHVIYECLSDQDTIFDLTQHTYFNLSNDHQKNNVLNHYLQINAQEFGSIDQDGMVDNELINVQDTVFDFQELKLIQAITTSNDLQIINAKQGIDHPFVLNK
ncbi:MAG: aldose epimerase family protein, partial [Bacilli bacterium]